METSTCIGIIQQVPLRVNPMSSKMHLYVHTTSPSYIERRVLMIPSIPHSDNHNLDQHGETLFPWASSCELMIPSIAHSANHNLNQHGETIVQGCRTASANDTVYRSFSQPQLRPTQCVTLSLGSMDVESRALMTPSLTHSANHNFENHHGESLFPWVPRTSSCKS